MKKQLMIFPFLSLILAALTISPSLFAASRADAPPFPPAISNRIQLQIQREMSFTANSETTSVLWTPHTITLQKWEATPTPGLNPFSPNEVNFLATFDVGMGNSMDGTDIYWRQCDVLINSIDGVWGDPVLDCDHSGK